MPRKSKKEMELMAIKGMVEKLNACGQHADYKQEINFALPGGNLYTIMIYYQDAESMRDYIAKITNENIGLTNALKNRGA